MPEPISIDITPEGLRTPAGAKKVAEAQRTWEDATAAVANAAALLLLNYSSELAAAIGKNKDMLADVNELRTLVVDRNRKQDTFLKALAGR